MQGRSCEPGIAEHPLILREGIGVSSVCTRQHHQTKSGRHGRGDAVLVRNKFERSEEHTSELQSRLHLVCRLLLEKKKKKKKNPRTKYSNQHTHRRHT